MDWYIACGAFALFLALLTRNVALALALVAGSMISFFIGVVVLPALGIRLG